MSVSVIEIKTLVDTSTIIIVKMYVQRRGMLSKDKKNNNLKYSKEQYSHTNSVIHKKS